MDKSDCKYLLVWLIPLSGFTGFYFQSWWTPGSFYLAFVLIPLLEFILPVQSQNDDESVKANKAKNKFYDVLLYLNLPVVYGLLAYFIFQLNSQNTSLWTWIGMILNMGIILGVLGINVAHELGHRPKRFEQLIAQLLLLPSLYMHFTQVHNFWHHKYVATPKDPSSANKNETVYRFWLRSATGSFINAIKIEQRKLSDANLPFLHQKNLFLKQVLIELMYLLIIIKFFGVLTLISVILAAILSILLLETINYIEHYGLKRIEIRPGLYEIVGDKHSWNSDHALGRIFLYELTRHPYHHEKTSEKYQNLDGVATSPQLPYGYPASMLLSLLPFAWFQIMDKHLLNP